mmetsp:Transcript_60925/g.170389  ORF Transcript_60925/g.170389 Transcript_60925/m.170389 type:complete len:237 (+) Transcript_60925:1640-2350(+)
MLEGRVHLLHARLGPLSCELASPIGARPHVARTGWSDDLRAAELARPIGLHLRPRTMLQHAGRRPLREKSWLVHAALRPCLHVAHELVLHGVAQHWSSAHGWRLHRPHLVPRGLHARCTWLHHRPEHLPARWAHHRTHMSGAGEISLPHLLGMERIPGGGIERPAEGIPRGGHASLGGVQVAHVEHGSMKKAPDVRRLGIQHQGRQVEAGGIRVLLEVRVGDGQVRPTSSVVRLQR